MPTLEASQADYRAVLAAVNALGANQRDMATTQREHSLRLASLETRVDEGFRQTDVRFRSVDEHLAEIKDLIIGLRDS